MNSSEKPIDEKHAVAITSNKYKIFVIFKQIVGVWLYEKSRDGKNEWSLSITIGAHFSSKNLRATLAMNDKYLAGSSNTVYRVFLREADKTSWKYYGHASSEDVEDYARPTVCSIDNEGNVLVSYKEQNLLRLMSPTGAFTTLKLTPPCSHPVSACVIGKSIYVLQHNSEKSVTVAKYS